MYYFEISGSVDKSGALKITGSKFPANAEITLRATYGGTIINTWAHTTSDGSGNIDYTQPDFKSQCTPGLWKIDATTALRTRRPAT